MYYSAEGCAIMGMRPGIRKDEISSDPNGFSWWVILQIFLFPISFGPWWLIIICMALDGLMLALFMPKGEKPPQDPPHRRLA
jgi:hypothetical protein